MVLFKWTFQKHNNEEYLYLHSTMVLFKWYFVLEKIGHANIYIPLWSYSNFVGGTIPATHKLFTFHYGPIQIKIGNEKCVYAV